jgi:hypothetical protein
MQLRPMRAALAVAAAVTFFSVAGVKAWAADTINVPEGTEVVIRFNDGLSSKTSSEGDRFSITTDEPIVLPDGTSLPAGYRGEGEVTAVEKRGMMGKPGQLNVRLDYVTVGNRRIHLRGSKGAEGKASVGATIVLTVLFGPLGLIKHGADVQIQPGQKMTTYVDEDTQIPAPPAPPPAGA